MRDGIQIQFNQSIMKYKWRLLYILTTLSHQRDRCGKVNHIPKIMNMLCLKWHLPKGGGGMLVNKYTVSMKMISVVGHTEFYEM